MLRWQPLGRCLRLSAQMAVIWLMHLSFGRILTSGFVFVLFCVSFGAFRQRTT